MAAMLEFQCKTGKLTLYTVVNCSYHIIGLFQKRSATPPPPHGGIGKWVPPSLHISQDSKAQNYTLPPRTSVILSGLINLGEATIEPPELP